MSRSVLDRKISSEGPVAHWSLLVGRIFYGIAFLAASVALVTRYAEAVRVLTALNAPFPGFITVSGIVIFSVCGLLLAAGVFARLAAFAASLFLLGLAGVFWGADGYGLQCAVTLSMAGGLMPFSVFGPGAVCANLLFKQEETGGELHASKRNV